MSFLGKIFGPSKNEVWEQLSKEIGADFKENGYWKDKVEVKVKDWIITLDTFVISSGKSTAPYTRLRAPYNNKDGFRFEIYRKHIFSGIAKIFGGQDIEVGFKKFDDDFIIKG